MKSLLLPLLILLFPLCSPAQPAPAGPARVLNDFCEQHRLPGASVAFRFHNGTAAALQYGLPPDAAMPAASVGKTFVAAAALRLARSGLLELDTPLARQFAGEPWFDPLPNAATLTPRHLLTHTGGLPDHVHLPEFADALAARPPGTGPLPPRQQLALLHHRPPLFPAGTAWAYSDSGYVLLGLLLEHLTREDLFDHIQTTLLTPLGLHHTHPSRHRRLPGIVQGHVTQPCPLGFPPLTLSPDGEFLWHPGVEGAGGGLLSTAADLARWGEALYTDRVLDPPAMHQLFTAVPVHPPEPIPAYGAGVVLSAHPRAGPALGHRGWIPGYVTSLQHYPHTGLTLAIQLNSDRPPAPGQPPLLQQLESLLLHHLLPKKTCFPIPNEVK